ncbi:MULTISPECIES: type VI secretion system-associated protein TagK [unclassified Escherichia]|uniref:type VI secretion system-associated protein TagK n=1 Tax=unclassified Escherichia TaxID=2608889 RepID=UPI001029CC4F|nr:MULTISPECIES: type VI secretion system-associated protein TagK [unclassified Escherichia]RZM85497.1 type VI secretion system-associated protein TagK [Escherichia sp. E1V33]TBR68614.1 type VI secretion system-associated protein TagK [Escherichia sp. E1S7]
MKQNITWGLQKIQEHGVTDGTIYTTAGTQIIFTTKAPWRPVFDVDEDTKIALSLTRHEEAWWIINLSDEYCCTVNDLIVEPHHRMRLNEGDLIEWGLSSWCLVRDNPMSLESCEEKTALQPVISPETITEYLDLDWFRQQQQQPQNPFDIIPVHGAVATEGTPDSDTPLTLLYQEYRQALLSPEQDIHRHADPFPLNGEGATQELSSLRDLVTEADTLQDMVTGGLSIDAILDVLDATGEGETTWPTKKTPPDILHLLSPEYKPEAVHTAILPDLTQREHRVIGIDSHYRINPAQHGDITHDKQ